MLFFILNCLGFFISQNSGHVENGNYIFSKQSFGRAKYSANVGGSGNKAKGSDTKAPLSSLLPLNKTGSSAKSQAQKVKTEKFN